MPDNVCPNASRPAHRSGLRVRFRLEGNITFDGPMRVRFRWVFSDQQRLKLCLERFGSRDGAGHNHDRVLTGNRAHDVIP